MVKAEVLAVHQFRSLGLSVGYQLVKLAALSELDTLSRPLYCPTAGCACLSVSTAVFLANQSSSFKSSRQAPRVSRGHRLTVAETPLQRGSEALASPRGASLPKPSKRFRCLLQGQRTVQLDTSRDGCDACAALVPWTPRHFGAWSEANPRPWLEQANMPQSSDTPLPSAQDAPERLASQDRRVRRGPREVDACMHRLISPWATAHHSEPGSGSRARALSHKLLPHTPAPPLTRPRQFFLSGFRR